ncbi:hypothetical protein [Baaleninema sp.]|uniref:hypothetical protein n=1 Tax=Baaleninema sp. TaxID=3101197 RepID=UPI003CFF232E
MRTSVRPALKYRIKGANKTTSALLLVSFNFGVVLETVYRTVRFPVWTVGDEAANG